MNLEQINRKVSWVALLVAALIVIPSVQQHRVNRSRSNERVADVQLARAMLELAALRPPDYAIPQIGAGMKEVK